MKTATIISLCFGAAALVAMLAFDAFGLQMADDTRAMLLALAGLVTGGAAGKLSPQSK